MRIRSARGLTVIELLIYVAILGTVAILVLSLGGVATGTMPFFAQSKCLAAGYPDYKMTWNWHAYCVKRVNQTDVVVPLEQVGR